MGVPLERAINEVVLPYVSKTPEYIQAKEAAAQKVRLSNMKEMAEIGKLQAETTKLGAEAVKTTSEARAEWGFKELSDGTYVRENKYSGDVEKVSFNKAKMVDVVNRADNIA